MAFTYSANGVDTTIDFETLPEASRAFIINYGLRQYLNDGAAVAKDWTPPEGETRTIEEEKTRRVNDRLTKLREGTVAERASAGRTAVSVEDRIWREMAVEAIKTAAKVQGKKMPKGDDREALITKVLASDKFREANVKEHKARVAMAKKSIDLGDFDLAL